MAPMAVSYSPVRLIVPSFSPGMYDLLVVPSVLVSAESAERVKVTLLIFVEMSVSEPAALSYWKIALAPASLLLTSLRLAGWSFLPTSALSLLGYRCRPEHITDSESRPLLLVRGLPFGLSDGITLLSASPVIQGFHNRSPCYATMLVNGKQPCCPPKVALGPRKGSGCEWIR